MIGKVYYLQRSKKMFEVVLVDDHGQVITSVVTETEVSANKMKKFLTIMRDKAYFDVIIKEIKNG